MRPRHQHLFYVLVLSLAQTGARAQSMNSPYSVYAIGDIDHRHYNFNSGMGYTGLALKTTLFQYGSNPASIAGLQKKFFTLDVSAAGRIVGYTGTAIDATNGSNRDFTIKKIALTTKVTNFWASGAGMRQFSSVNYQFHNNRQVEGSNSIYPFTYSGDGGLNEYYWNNAFSIGKHLSAGVTASFLAGSVNQTETLVDESGATISGKREDYYANGRFQYGLIYSTALSKNWNLAFGASYAARTSMNFARTLNITEDTTTLVKDKYLSYNPFSLPQSIAGGLALSNKAGTVTYAADYSFDNWSALSITGTGWQLVNSNRISGGMEFSSYKKVFNSNAAKTSYQIGGFVNNSYLRVNNQQIREWGVTAGTTRSVGNSLLVGASLEGGVRGTTQGNLIRENYIQLSLHFSYRDFLFGKVARYN